MARVRNGPLRLRNPYIKVNFNAIKLLVLRAKIKL